MNVKSPDISLRWTPLLLVDDGQFTALLFGVVLVMLSTMRVLRSGSIGVLSVNVDTTDCISHVAVGGRSQNA